MKTIHRLGAIAAALTLFAVAAVSADQAPAATSESVQPLDIARLTTDGKLQKPADLVNWVFLGASLGMGYNPGSFNAARPGQFQVALMEPTAFRYFVEHGSYAPGSMFVLAFYDADVQPRSINQNGFTQADLTNFEIHLVDPKSKEGHTFYMFSADSKEGRPLPAGNACVTCHVNHGAFQGTFAQFYPTARPYVPKEALEKAAQDHNIH